MQIHHDLQQRLQQHQELYASISKRSKLLSTSRVISFGSGVLFFVLFLNGGPGFYLYLVFAALLLFFFILNKDKQNHILKTRAANLVDIDQEEIARLHGELSGLDAGEQYLDPKHVYSQDLDIFGKNSLFQHVNRSSLDGSKDLLASWFSQPATLREVRERQHAILELKRQEEWTLQLQARMRGVKATRSGDIKLQNAASSNEILIAFFTALIFSSVTLAIMALGAIGWINPLLIWVAVIVNAIALFIYNLKVQKKATKSSYLLKALQVFLTGMEHIKAGSFHSSLLVDAQNIVDRKALKSIKSLKQIVYLLDSRENLMWVLVNLTLLVDLYSFCLLNMWIRKYGKAFNTWIEVIYQFEAYGSCASYWQLHPDFTLPDLQKTGTTWTAESLGHPLIDPSQRITNDFALDSKINLVTGSNMSGKSTFLRTIGLNTIMSWAGLPVCASKLTLSPFQPYTSMRTQDDLSAGASSFYAELKRLQGLFTILEHDEQPRTLFLLDEILKGTNSHDRHTGGLGIIERLLALNSMGFVSTHDLALADHYEKDVRVRSLSFVSEMKEDQLHFDYKLQEGKCQSTNASQLMKIMNIIE